MENRARFPVRMLSEMRSAMGNDMILELRMSAEDGVEGGMTIDDSLEFFRIIDGMADIIHISNGLKWAGERTHTFTGMYDAHGYNVQFAEKVKQVVSRSKVAVIGGINSPEYAEQIIAEGKTDFVIMGRQMYADPDFANKVAEGKEDRIRRCVRCFQCYPGTMEHETDIPFEIRFSEVEKKRILNPASMGRCAINPESNFRLYPEDHPLPDRPRKVLIAGGGVAGIQAAITAAGRGNTVTLAEKSDKLGGTVNFTDADPDKIDLRNAKNVLIKDLMDSGTRVRLNTEVTPEMISKELPEALIIAIGAEPVRPGIKGIERAMNALEMYDYPERVGQRVAMIGGGLVGCEAGLYLREMGKDVTIIEMTDILAREAWCMYRTSLMDEMDRRGIKVYWHAICREINENCIIIDTDKGEEAIPADTVIYCVGMRSRTESVNILKRAAEEAGVSQVFTVGDCDRPGKVGDAVPAGHLAALKIR